MVEFPTRPTVTRVVVCLPFFSTVTVESWPVVVTAALGTSSTFVAVWTTTLTSAVIPSSTEAGGFVSMIVSS